MKPYSTPAAFRAALESRLKNAARARNLTPMRLRKVVTFDRFVARLVAVAPDRWLLKGGAALDFRLQDRARTTMDLDMAFLAEQAQVDADVIEASRTDLSDYFTFAAERIPVPAGQEDVTGSFRIRALIAGRLFEQIQLDVAWTDPFIGSELVHGESLLSFAGIEPATVPAIPIEQHAAEKLHAYTRVYASGPSSRVKDLVDVVLIALHRGLDAGRLAQALNTTFRARNSHSLPATFPSPPAAWEGPYRRLAEEVSITGDMVEAHRIVAALLDPILAGQAPGTAHWNPATQSWGIQ